MVTLAKAISVTCQGGRTNWTEWDAMKRRDGTRSKGDLLQINNRQQIRKAQHCLGPFYVNSPISSLSSPRSLLLMLLLASPLKPKKLREGCWYGARKLGRNSGCSWRKDKKVDWFYFLILGSWLSLPVVGNDAVERGLKLREILAGQVKQFLWETRSSFQGKDGR